MRVLGTGASTRSDVNPMRIILYLMGHFFGPESWAYFGVKDSTFRPRFDVPRKLS